MEDYRSFRLSYGELRAMQGFLKQEIAFLQAAIQRHERMLAKIDDAMKTPSLRRPVFYHEHIHSFDLTDVAQACTVCGMKMPDRNRMGIRVQSIAGSPRGSENA